MPHCFLLQLTGVKKEPSLQSRTRASVVVHLHLQLSIHFIHSHLSKLANWSLLALRSMLPVVQMVAAKVVPSEWVDTIVLSNLGGWHVIILGLQTIPV